MMSKKDMRRLIAEVVAPLLESRRSDDLARKIEKARPNEAQPNLVSELEPIRPGHFQWIWKMVQHDPEPLPEILSIVRDFDKYASRLASADLYSYNSVTGLRDAIESLPQSRSERRGAARRGADLIYEDDSFVVFYPNTEAASCEIGNRYGKGGVEWCTTSERSKNAFERYHKNGIHLYYVINKDGDSSQDPMAKIAVAIVNRNGLSSVIDGDAGTVDAVKNDLTRSEISSYLGDSSRGAFGAMMKDASTRGETDFEGMMKDLTVEEYDLHLEELERRGDESFANNWRRYIAAHSPVSDEVLRHISETDPDEENREYARGRISKRNLMNQFSQMGKID